MASSKWNRGSYPAGFEEKDRAGPCSNPWSTGRMTSLPVPASAPWFKRRAMFVLVPGLSELYQERISRTRSVERRVPAACAADAFGARTVSGFIGASIVRRFDEGQALSGFRDRGVAGGAQEGRALVSNDPYGDRSEERAQMVLVPERLEENVPVEGRQDLGRDSSTQVDSGPRQGAQGQVAGLGAVDAHEEPKRVLARAAGSLHAEPADVAGRPVLAAFGDMPRPHRGLPALLVEQLRHRGKARARENPLVAHAAIAGAERAEDAQLVVRARREIGVSRFGGDRNKIASHAHQDGFAEPGAGRHESGVALIVALPGLNRLELVRLERREPIAVRHEDVDEMDALQLELPGEVRRLDGPPQVGHAGAVFHDRPRDAEAGRRGVAGVAGAVILEQRLERGISVVPDVLHRKRGTEPPVAKLELGDVGFGPADVAGQDHRRSSSSACAVVRGRRPAAPRSRIQITSPFAGETRA